MCKLCVAMKHDVIVTKDAIFRKLNPFKLIIPSTRGEKNYFNLHCDVI